jgi:Cof subfamily protein (haloacid dehalogenase superfamily)
VFSLLPDGKIRAVKPLVRLIALDIDGTLLDPNFQISDANLNALRRAHAAGIEIVLGTGRRHAFAMPVAQALGFDVWLISSNGAVTKSSRDELFHRDLLPAPVARRLIRHMDEYRPYCVLTFDVEGHGALVIETPDTLNGSIQRWMEKNAAYIQAVIPIENALTIDPIQAMFCGPVERMKQAEARLATGDFVADVTVLKTQYDARNLCILDVLNKDCSKGHALRRWAQHRGYRREEVMAIGDNYNDIEMLEFAGIPYIMGNASEDLKSNGFRVTLGNDQSGVAMALQEIGI